LSKILPDKYRNDSRRRFIGTKSEVVLCRGNRSTQHVSIFMYGFDGVYKKRKEHEVGLWRFARCQQIHTRVGAHAPVVMLAISIDAGKWFFVQQYPQLMTRSYACHNI